VVLIIRTLSEPSFFHKSCLKVGITLLLSKPAFFVYQPDSPNPPPPHLPPAQRVFSVHIKARYYCNLFDLPLSAVCLNWINYFNFPDLRKLHLVPNFVMKIFGKSSCPLFVLRMLAHRLDVKICKLLFKVIIDFTYLRVKLLNSYLHEPIPSQRQTVAVCGLVRDALYLRSVKLADTSWFYYCRRFSWTSPVLQ